MISFSLMARTPSSIAKLLRRPSPKITQNHNQQFRDIGNDGYCNDSQDKPQHSSEIVKVICGTIRSKPRWENTLLSDFPDVNFSDSTFLNQLLLHQKNALLSIRLLYWLHSTFGYSPAPSTCSLIFNALVEDKSAKAAKTFLEFTHFVPDPAGLESYMRCLCESRMIKDALQVLDEMKNTGVCPSLETWNCLLLASIKVGNADLVWELYNDMMEFGVVADLDTVSYLIQSFCLDKNVTKGYQLLRQVLKDGYVPHKSAFDKLLFEFILDQKYDRVPALLHIMIAKNIKPDLYTYQQIIHGLCLTRMQREGLFIFNNLKNRGYAPDKIMYTTMIHGLCKMKWITDARKLWFEMIEKGIEPNQYTYNTLLYGYFRIGHIEMAQNLYKEMKKEYKETLVTYNTMINGLSSHGKTMEAFQLFNQMDTQNISKDVITYNSLIKGFCKEGKLTEGLTLLRELIDQGLQPSSASYGPIIGKLYELGRMSEVKILWDEMQDKGVEPAAPCIDEHIIIGMSNKGYIETGVYWLEYMVHNRLVPCQGTFEKLIAILCQKDKLDVGSSVFGHMFKIGYTPSSRMKDLSLMGANSFGSSLIV